MINFDHGACGFPEASVAKAAFSFGPPRAWFSPQRFCSHFWVRVSLAARRKGGRFDIVKAPFSGVRSTQAGECGQFGRHLAFASLTSAIFKKSNSHAPKKGRGVEVIGLP